MKKSFWWFFPLTGIKITDCEPNLENPLFEDATILSQKTLMDIVEAGNWPEKDYLSKKIGESTLLKKSDSLLAVKMIANKELDKARKNLSKAREYTETCFASNPDPPVLRNAQDAERASNEVVNSLWNREVKSAEFRANEIASFLMLLVLNDSDCNRTCGLSYRVAHRIHDFFSLSTDDKEWSGSYRLSNPIKFPKLYSSFTRQELKDHLENSILSAAGKLVLYSSSAYSHETCSIAIRQAVRRFGESIYANETSEIVAGAVTAFEILLKGRYTKTKKVKQRLAKLTGIEEQEFKELYDSRHSLLHAGVPVESSLLHPALNSTIRTIAAFSNTAIASPTSTLKQIKSQIDRAT